MYVFFCFDKRCSSGLAVLRGYLQISVKFPVLGGKRDSLAEVGEGISYPLTDKRQSTILHHLAAFVLGFSRSRFIRFVLLVPAQSRRGRLRRILGISSRGHPSMKMWDPGKIHVVRSLLLAEFMSPLPKKNYRPDLERKRGDLLGPVPEVLPCVNVLLVVIQGWEQGRFLAGIGVGAGWIWWSEVQVARTTNGAHIFKKEIKIKSCNKKRSSRTNHYMKPYPLNNLYWNPKFEKIGS